MYMRWTTAARRAVRVRVMGLVQGVGYRDWLVRRASDAGVAGWVRNRRELCVEAMLQGSAEACDRLTEMCADGPRAARVTRVEVRREPYDHALDGRFEQRPSV